MYSEDDLLNLLLKSPNSKSIRTIAEQLEIGHNFSFSENRNDLTFSNFCCIFFVYGVVIK